MVEDVKGFKEELSKVFEKFNANNDKCNMRCKKCHLAKEIVIEDDNGDFDVCDVIYNLRKWCEDKK